MSILNRHFTNALKGLVLSLCLLMGPHGKAQLALESCSLPDTLSLFSQISVQFSVKNVGNSSRVGNLQLMFRNASNDSIVVPLGGFTNTLQFFAPQQTRGFEVPIDITPDFFIEGGNTVVIWPSMAADPNEVYITSIDTVYILGLSSTSPLAQKVDELYFLENPVNEQLVFNKLPPAGSEISIFDTSGRMLQHGNLSEATFSLNSMPTGLYLAVIRNKGRIIKQLNFICQ
jgi:hypothetical protein